MYLIKYLCVFHELCLILQQQKDGIIVYNMREKKGTKLIGCKKNDNKKG